jgi:hypothetical protein
VAAERNSVTAPGRSVGAKAGGYAEHDMNLIDLIVLVCSLTNPGFCHEEHLLFQSQGSPRSCVMQAQPYLAQWIGDHPTYQIKQWHCEWPDVEPGKA